MCHITEANGVGEMALKAVVDFLACRHFLLRTKKSMKNSAAKEALIGREKAVLRAETLKKSKLSLSYMAHRTFSSGIHRQAIWI